MRVAHYHRQRHVTQQISHRFQRRSILHQMAGKRVPHVVTTEVLNAQRINHWPS